MFHRNPPHLPSEVKNVTSKDAEKITIAARSSLRETSTNNLQSLLKHRELGRDENPHRFSKQQQMGQPKLSNYQSPEILRQRHKNLASKLRGVQSPIVLPNAHRLLSLPIQQSQLRQSVTYDEPTTPPNKCLGVHIPGSDSTIEQESLDSESPPPQNREHSLGHVTQDEWEAALSLILLHQHTTYADENNIPREVLRTTYVSRFGDTCSEDVLSEAATKAIEATPQGFNSDDLRWLIWAVKQMGTVVNADHFRLLARDFSIRYPNKQVTAEQLYYKWATWHEEMSRADGPLIREEKVVGKNKRVEID